MNMKKTPFNKLIISSIVLSGLLTLSHGLTPAFAERLGIPLGKAVSVKARLVTEIRAVKPDVVEVLTVTDDEIVLSGASQQPDSTQVIIKGAEGTRIIDVETFVENQVIQQKFQALFGQPGVEVQFFADSAYLRGRVDVPDKSKRAEMILAQLVKDIPIVNLIEIRAGATVVQRIENAIGIPTVRVSVINPNDESLGRSGRGAGGPPAAPAAPGAPSAPAGAAPGAGAPSQASAAPTGGNSVRVILEGSVKNQNDFMHMVEVVRGFVPDSQISNLVIIEDPLQVIFQAFILQVDKRNQKDLGILWGGSQSQSGQNFLQGTWRFVENMDNAIRGDPTTQSLGAPVPGFPNPFHLNNINRFDIITANVKALENKRKLKVLANPKLVVYANTTPSKIAGSGWMNEAQGGAGAYGEGLSYVRVGQDTYFPSKIDNQGNITYEKAASDLVLSVRDLFINDNHLKFSVYALQEEPLAKPLGPPDISRRSVQTTVKVQDGETIILGGLINRSVDVQEDGIPILSKIPYLGRIFKSKVTRNNENELIIILTPQIVNQEKNLAGGKKFETISIPHRTERLDELHNLFQDIKSRHFPKESSGK